MYCQCHDRLAESHLFWATKFWCGLASCTHHKMELSSNEDRYLTALLTATLDRWLYVFPAKRNQIELKAVYPVSDSPFIRPSRIPDMPKFKLKKILMDLLGSSGTQTTQVNEASEAQTVTQR